MKKLILSLVLLFGVTLTACTQAEAKSLADSSLANNILTQHSPSDRTHSQLIFDEDHLYVMKEGVITPETLPEDLIASSEEEYDNITVTEEDDRIIVTDDGALKLEFKILSDRILEDQDGVRFARMVIK